MRIKKLLSFLLCLVFCFGIFTVSVSADEAFSYYTYWDGYSTKEAYQTKATYTVKDTISNDDWEVSSLVQPSDLYYDGQYIYLLDSGNGRVLILDEEYKIINQIDNFTQDGQKIEINGATGVFATDDSLYIANPELGNIIISDMSGEISGVIRKPESNVIPDDFNFRPSKLVVDSRGFMYVTCEECYYGAFVFDSDGNFLSLFGSNKVEGTVLDALQKLWDIITNNSAKRANSIQNLPYQFVNIHVDNEDFIYTVTGKANSYGTIPGQIKKLSPSGANILKFKEGYKSQSASSFDFGDTTIPVDVATGMKRILNFIALTTDESGYIYAVDRTYGKVFVYDDDCNCITVFGCSDGSALYNGTFKYVSDIAVVNGDILVLDSELGTVTVFEPTDYVKTIMNANLLTRGAHYEEAMPLWQEVLAVDKNSQLAYRGLAKSYLKTGDYEKAMEYAQIGVDQDTYSLAYKKVNAKFMSKNFVWIFALSVILIIAFIVFAIVKKRKNIVLIKNRRIAVLLSEILHPFEAFTNIKQKNEGSILISTILLLVFSVMSVFTQLYGGFMYTVFDSQSFNPFITFFKSLGIIVLWVIVNWGICTLSLGKGKVKEIYTVTCYSLLPLIINQFLFMILSHVITNESAAITICAAVCYIFAGWLLCIGMMTVHEYSFPKFLGTTILTVAGMLFIVFVLFMIFILGQEFVSFVSTIFKEVAYR